MSPTLRRLLTIGGGAAVFCGAALMILFGLSGNRLFFHDPSMVVAGEFDLSKAFRLGGLVEPNSWTRDADGLVHRFRITDCLASVAVEYRGLLPDLFIEGQGAVARGKIDPETGVMIANEVLARHDEAYTPKEVEDSLSNVAPKGEYAALIANGCDTVEEPAT